ncbi:MAG: GNAT family N-acetyltransferase [Bacteroidetes bacterium]|nr:GNAT family N-acetyltransferase [Bacteroidota bacterium]
MLEGVFIRDFVQDDRKNVLELFRMNTPTFFSPEEEDDLIYYLDNEIEKYFVVQLDEKIVGCGGINFKDDGAIGLLSWDFLHPQVQRQGVGTILLKHRINILKSIPTVKKIKVRTSQHAYTFYEKGGFELIEKVKDYWAVGFDLYLMEYN